jgi:hypothetical protein
MILAASFEGERAMHQAHELVLELRKSYKLNAYLHARQFDFTKPERGLGLTEDGRPKMMRHKKAAKELEVAVLVGDFDSVDDPRAHRALDAIKHAEPACLKLSRHAPTSQQYAALRAAYQRITVDDERRKMGPMRAAFVTANPMLPKEFFVSSGLDPVVVEMNRGVQHSLLDCPGKISVKVATFRGDSTMPLREKQIEQVEEQAPSNHLVYAALKAHALTVALRERGYEAYEFHDRHESVVSVGSFESVGAPMPDGTTELHPGIHRIMQEFGAERTPWPRAGAEKDAVVGKKLGEVHFDIQPVPILVPQTSIAGDYARRGILR